MNDLNELILRIHKFDELRNAIDLLAGEIRRLSGTSRVSAAEAQALNSFLTQLRLLANEIERSEVCAQGPSKEMAGRYLDLENLIRMLRNDLDAIVMRVSR